MQRCPQIKSSTYLQKIFTSENAKLIAISLLILASLYTATDHQTSNSLDSFKYTSAMNYVFIVLARDLTMNIWRK